MKYALLIYGATLAPEASDAETREGWIEYARAAKEAGILLGAEQLAGTDTATSVRVRGGERLLTDGPFLGDQGAPSRVLPDRRARPGHGAGLGSADAARRIRHSRGARGAHRQLGLAGLARLRPAGALSATTRA
jgi:hypothetical protein